MNSVVKKMKKKKKQRGREKEGEKRPRHSASVGSSCSQVHLPADETWLIAVAVPVRRPAPARTWHSGLYLTVSSSASFIFIHPRLSPLLAVLHLLLVLHPAGSSRPAFFFYRLFLPPLTAGSCSYFPRACPPSHFLLRLVSPRPPSLLLSLSFSPQLRLFNRVRWRICI